MPRSGSFSGATHAYGQPLPVVKPPDNDITKGRYSTELEQYSKDHNLTLEQKNELQRQIDELYGSLLLTRDTDFTW